jgi:hypothetical protein
MNIITFILLLCTQNLQTTINKVAKFLQHEPLDDEQVSMLANHLDIKNFRNNSAVNFDLLRNIGLLNEGEESFIRKGIIHTVQY